MQNDWQKLFSSLSEINPPAGLQQKILERLRQAQKRAIFWRLIFFSSTTILSLVALVPVLQTAYARLIESGFTRFFSLLFSDFTLITSFWRSFAMSLLETLPIMSLVVILIVLAVFLESIKLLDKETKKFSAIQGI